MRRRLGCPVCLQRGASPPFHSGGKQIEHPIEWNPSDHLMRLKNDVSVEIQNRDVKVEACQYSLQSPTGGEVPVIFLDTDLEGNRPVDKTIAHNLYGGGETYRLKQEIVLGIGGVKVLNSLGFDIRKYHMNEGHSGLLTLELLSVDFCRQGSGIFIKSIGIKII